MVVQGQPGQKVIETLISANRAGSGGGHACHSSHRRSVNRRIMVQVGWDRELKPYLKNKNEKGLGCSSSGREPAYQMQGPEFILQYRNNNKKDLNNNYSLSTSRNLMTS
jgi:hypothetical protein